MTELRLSIGEPFTSPAWGSNFVVFSNGTGLPIAEEETKAYLAKACRYASRYNVYLVPERFMMLQNQSMCLINPEGNVMGAQQGIFENPSIPVEKGNDRIDVVKTEFGNIFLCVDTDVFHPEVAKVAFNQGAKIAICSQFFTGMQFSSHRIVSGIWSIAQGNSLFAIGVSGYYHAICAPKSMTKHKDGFYLSPTTKMPSTATLSVHDLDSLPPRPTLSRRIYALHREDLIGSQKRDKSDETEEN